MNAVGLIGALRSRDFALAATNGQLVVRPASRLTTGDREAIRRHLPELLTALVAETGASPDLWDTDVARRLTHDADTLVGELGVSGLHPNVQGAAEGVVRAYGTQNMAALRVAVSAFVSVVRGLAACPTTANAESAPK